MAIAPKLSSLCLEGIKAFPLYRSVWAARGSAGAKRGAGAGLPGAGGPEIAPSRLPVRKRYASQSTGRSVSRAAQMGGHSVSPSYRSEHEIQRRTVTRGRSHSTVPPGQGPPPGGPSRSPPGLFCQVTRRAATPAPSRLVHHRVLKSSPGFPKETYFGFSLLSSAHLKKSESPFLIVWSRLQTGSEARHKNDAEPREPAGLEEGHQACHWCWVST